MQRASVLEMQLEILQCPRVQTKNNTKNFSQTETMINNLIMTSFAVIFF